ncbi:MAG: glycosyltransferase family 2 protein [Lachnospiraceae bacterium]|nr:glycosyltransferase family 2 protein [Lachnospiraceae bacterium]
MKKLWKKKRTIEFHIDRTESSYGNLMLRGWAVNLEEDCELTISVQDGTGEPLSVYVERLVRADVNEMFGKESEYESGFHILIDRAMLNTPNVWLIFQNGTHEKREKIRITESNGFVKHLQVSRLRRKQKSCISGNSEDEDKVNPVNLKGKEQKQESKEPADYDLWIRAQEPNAAARRIQRRRHFAYMPKFSVVIPLYNTPLVFLKEIIDSVLNQTYTNVELCLADGSTDDAVGTYIRRYYRKETRIRYRRLKENKGISENTNAAIRMSSGDFIVFADHDDVLACDALYEMAMVLNQSRDVDVIYTDEDKVNRSGTAYFGPHFKPDFNWELLCCNNYICHLFAVRRDIVKKTGLLDSAFDGAQDYDFVLRCCEKAEHVLHIPKVLYHWRTHPASTAGNPESKEYAFEAGRKALEAHYRRVGIQASAEHTGMRGRYRTRNVIDGIPHVTILIPNKDHVGDLKRCLESIWAKTTYPEYDVLIVENNSVEPETFAYYKDICSESSAGKKVRVIVWEGAFDYAGIHNDAVLQAEGEYVVLLNNDTEVIDGSWIEELLGLCQRPEVGAVGAKLYYPDGTIQHAGIVLGLGGPAGHLYAGFPGDKEGYMGRLVSVQQVSAVTGACMMTKKSVYKQVNGMGTEFAVAYNDVDYCLKLREAGYHVVFTPYAGLYHYESKSRGYEDTEAKRSRLEKEAAVFCRKWKKLLDAGDPCYNRNLSLVKADCSLRAE